MYVEAFRTGFYEICVKNKTSYNHSIGWVKDHHSVRLRLFPQRGITYPLINHTFSLLIATQHSWLCTSRERTLAPIFCMFGGGLLCNDPNVILIETDMPWFFVPFLPPLGLCWVGLVGMPTVSPTQRLCNFSYTVNGAGRGTERLHKIYGFK